MQGNSHERQPEDGDSYGQRIYDERKQFLRHLPSPTNDYTDPRAIARPGGAAGSPQYVFWYSTLHTPHQAASETTRPVDDPLGQRLSLTFCPYPEAYFLVRTCSLQIARPQNLHMATASEPHLAHLICHLPHGEQWLYGFFLTCLGSDFAA
jgi:hypothetical protein